ncbi:SixA phosphatase family protein [Aestuariibius sp. 2305UL40-4]|uniref:SixA phosphatase family protein n=1 Tax=Aestuariibius violaceus TaxID=3234132 RepID=UPI00345E265F
MNRLAAMGVGVSLGLMAGMAAAQEEGLQGNVGQVSTHMGEMSVTMPNGEEAVQDRLRFEPFQMVDELFLRDDIVFLMRHGPTDWSFLDRKDVAPTDCENQRVMDEEGRAAMRALGTLMAANEILPGKIIVSEWCRNQQTLEELQAGFADYDPAIPDQIPVETNPDLNLLLSLQGAPDVVGLREMITNWDGQVGDGPLLLISHFTNIEELTNFQVFEGEMLMIDPDRDNRVIGYLRLRSAAPDVGHFDTEEAELEAAPVGEADSDG